MTGQKARQLGVIVALLCLCSAFIIVEFGSRLYSQSVDIGWHYSLAYFLTQSVSLPGTADQHLQVMLGYPPGFHVAAALAGTVLGSPLFGMQYLALLSVFGSYCVIAWIILSRRLSLLAGAAFLVFLVCFRTLFGGLIGYEIIDNAFYPQLFGTAFFLGFMSILSRLGGSPASYFGFAVATTFLTAWVYTLSAAWLAFGACILFVLLQPKRMVPRWWAVANFVVLPLIVLLHPTFKPMVENARHEGGFVPVYFWLTLVLAIALVILSPTLLTRSPYSMRSRADSLFVGILSASVAGIIVQASLFYLAGLGSRYAVTKQVFLASTIFIAAMSVIFADLVAKVEIYNDTKVQVPPMVRNIGIIVIALIAVIAVFYNRPSTSLSAFVAYVFDARSLEHASAPRDLAGNTLSLNNEFDAGQNFAVLATHFRGAWTASSNEFFEVWDDRARPLGAPMGARYSLVSRRQWDQLAAAGAPQDCQVQTSAPLAVSALLLSRCYPDRSGQAEVQFCIDVWSPGDGTKMGAGFAEPEFTSDGAFQWTVSLRSELEKPLGCGSANNRTIRVLVGFAVSERTLDSFGIEINGQPVPLRRRPVRMGQLFEGSLSNGMIHEGDQSVFIALKVSGLDRPQGGNRYLGVALRRIEILGSKLIQRSLRVPG